MVVRTHTHTAMDYSWIVKSKGLTGFSFSWKFYILYPLNSRDCHLSHLIFQVTHPYKVARKGICTWFGRTLSLSETSGKSPLMHTLLWIVRAKSLLNFLLLGNYVYVYPLDSRDCPMSHHLISQVALTVKGSVKWLRANSHSVDMNSHNLGRIIELCRLGRHFIFHEWKYNMLLLLQHAHKLEHIVNFLGNIIQIIGQQIYARSRL